MNMFTKSLLATLVLGAASTAIYADTDKPPKPQGPKGCQTECTGQIPIELKVERHCDLEVLTNKITLADGGSGNGQFKVGANAPYNLKVWSTNNSNVMKGADSIPITITTKLGTTDIPLNTPQVAVPVALGGWNTYDVNVTSNAVGITKPAGTYTDMYNIKVYF